MREPVYRRGDVLLVPLPFVGKQERSKLRPALLVQDDVGNRFSPNLILALVSSTIPSKIYPTHYHIRAKSQVGRASGLKRDSIVKAEAIVTLPKTLVRSRIGALPPIAMLEVDRCLRVSLDL